jgi:hypothetical protein
MSVWNLGKLNQSFIELRQTETQVWVIK